ncbi:MAG: cysteine-rich KTR domain-containing protein [Roseburia sp.]
MLYNTSRGEIVQHTYKWYKCPKCGNPKMLVVRDDTVLVNFPGYCKKCKEQSIITIEPKSRIVNS